MLLLLGVGPAWANSPPVVSNVTSSQRTDGSKLVDIRYNLADADGDACTVTVQASGDGGATWTVPITAFQPGSQIGAGITPGTNKLITWNSTTDLPGAFGSQYKVRVCADDGHIPMALIPAGEFLMGNSFDPGEGYSDELPRHAVYVDAFYMDTCEVSNQQYADALNWAKNQGNLITVTSGRVYKYGSGTSYPYCETTTSSSYSRITWNGTTFGVTSGKESHPMVKVSWYGSVAYANWRSGMQGKPLCYDLSTWTCNFGSGYRLPTEAEWERAARGGAAGHRFPWSDTDTIQHARANYYSYSNLSYDTSPTRGDHPLWGVGATPWTSPVGFFTGALQYKVDWGWPGTPASYQTTNSVNGYGLHDMAGNVWEWCNDWYGSSYYSSSPYDDPHGPESGSYRVLRGGGWSYGAICCRCAYRTDASPGGWNHIIGFRLALDSDRGFRESDCENSAAFTIDNRGGGVLAVYQKAVGIFLADVPFNNTFKAVVSDWGGSQPGLVYFSLGEWSDIVPYDPFGEDGAETSAFDMGGLPSSPCAVTSILSVMAKNSSGATVAQTTVPLKCINRLWSMPGQPFVQVKALSPSQWGQEIIYEACIGLPPICFDSLQNLDATWYGENALFKDYGGLISGGELSIEFNGRKGEYTWEIGTDLSLSEKKDKLGTLRKPTTHKQKMDWEGDGTLAAQFSATATINPASGCFDSSPEACAGFQGGYEWQMIPIGPMFGIPGLWFTGKAGFDIGPEVCFEPLEWSLDNVAPFTAFDVNFNLTAQGGLELGIPYFLSIFGGLEGNAEGKIHVLGDPVPTCWDWPMLADLGFDLSIVGYARLGFSEWELGRYVIVQWNCNDKKGLWLVPPPADPPVMRMAGRPYLENGEPYALYAPGGRGPRDGDAETDELVTSNVNLEAVPAIAGWGNLTLMATSEDDPSTPGYVEHEIHAAFRDGSTWGQKLQITNNSDPDILPTAGFDASGKAIVAWTTVAGVTGSETLPEAKAKMEIAYSTYDSGLQTWTAPTLVTDDGGALDALPQIVRGADSSTNLVWLHSADNSLPIGPDELLGPPLSVMVARWDGASFGAPGVLVPSCDAVGPIRYARGGDGREYLLWTRDVDGDLATIGDQEVVESHTVGGVWTAPALLTSNAVPETAVGLVATTSGGSAYYVRPGAGGTPTEPRDLLLARAFDGSTWSSEATQIAAPTILAPSFAMGADNAVGCAWVGPSFNGGGKGVLYATSPTGLGGWSEPQEMATGPAPLRPSCAYTGSNIQVGYVSARTMDKTTVFDVRLLDHTPYTDAWIDAAGITVSPQPPVGGQPATISVAVHLSGDFPQAGVSVEVFDGDPSQGGTLIGSATTDLTPGEIAVLEFPWTYPSDFNQHEVYAFVDRGNTIPELNENNNSAHVAIGGLNLRAVSVNPVFWSAETIGVRVTIENASYATLANVAFELRRDSETGPLILSDTLPSVPAGEQVEMVVPWDITLTSAGVYELFLLVDPSGVVAEREESDNVVSGQFRVLPDLQAEQWSARIASGAAHVTVRNVGAKPMAATIARVMSGEQNLGEATVPALDAGGSADVAITLGVVPAGWLSIIVNPDSNGSDEVTLLNNTAIAAAYSRGDMNCDGAIGVEDVTLFVEALLDPVAFDAAHPNCGSNQADINQSGVADGVDIQQFVSLLIGA